MESESVIQHEASRTAHVNPPVPRDDGTVSFPSILIAGQEVKAWVQDGVLCVDVECHDADDTDDTGTLNIEDPGRLVPVCFSVGGETAAMLGPEPEAWK